MGVIIAVSIRPKGALAAEAALPGWPADCWVPVMNRTLPGAGPPRHAGHAAGGSEHGDDVLGGDVVGHINALDFPVGDCWGVAAPTGYARPHSGLLHPPSACPIL